MSDDNTNIPDVFRGILDTAMPRGESMKIINTGRQIIETKYLGPTNYRPARVKAIAEAGSVMISWDHALDTNENHNRAVMALVKKMKWNESAEYLLSGGKDNGNVYLFVPPIRNFD